MSNVAFAFNEDGTVKQEFIKTKYASDEELLRRYREWTDLLPFDSHIVRRASAARRELEKRGITPTR